MSDNFKCKHKIHWTDCFTCNPTEEQIGAGMTPTQSRDEERAEKVVQENMEGASMCCSTCFRNSKMEEVISALRYGFHRGLRESRTESQAEIEKLKKELGQLGRDKMSNDADYLKLSASVGPRIAEIAKMSELLERAYKLMEIAAEFYERNDENATGEHLWLADYAALTKGAE